MTDRKRLIYGFAYGLFGAILFASVFGVLYSHFRIGELETILGQFGRVLSTEQRELYEHLGRIRLFAAIGVVVSTSALTAIGFAYYGSVDTPRSKMERGLLAGLLLSALLGTGVYAVSEDLSIQVIGLALTAVGFVVVLAHLVYLSSWGWITNGGVETTDGHCSGCGSRLSSRNTYCWMCGDDD